MSAKLHWGISYRVLHDSAVQKEDWFSEYIMAYYEILLLFKNDSALQLEERIGSLRNYIGVFHILHDSAVQLEDWFSEYILAYYEILLLLKNDSALQLEERIGSL